MVKNTALEELDSKISLMIEKYEQLKEENRILKEKVSASDAVEARLNQEIARLKEEDEMKDLELEDIAIRVAKTLGIEEFIEERELKAS